VTPRKFDLIVLGTGVAGSTIATQCCAAGWQVAIVDQRPFGGTCLLRGCMPKKVLAHAAAVLDAVNRMRDKGLTARQVGINWCDLMGFKRYFTDEAPENTRQRFSEQGIVCCEGKARFAGPNRLMIDDHVWEAHFVAVATGAEPARLPIDGCEHLIDSEAFFELDCLPPRIIFVGGGYIAFELAHIAARAGAKVTILHQGKRPLEAFDADIVSWLVERTRRLGVNVHLGHAVTRIEAHGARRTVHTECHGREANFETELVVHAAGRAPALESLQPDAGGIALEDGRIKLDRYLRSTTNHTVYAAGDAACQGEPLTPVAELDARCVAHNLIEGDGLAPTRSPDYTAVPSLVFTTPPIAKVGLSEDQARARTADLKIRCEPTSSWFASKHTAEPCAGFKTLVHGRDDRLLGAHLMSSDAQELANLFALAIRNGITATQLRHTPLAFPTVGHDIAFML
jgi:glutathione reductase (NADPH)